MKQKKNVLKYEKVDRVSRWNYIQFISKMILESSISNSELEKIVIEIQNPNRKLILDIK